MALSRSILYFYHHTSLLMRCAHPSACSKLLPTLKLSFSSVQREIADIESICQKLNQALKMDITNIDISGTLALLRKQDPKWMFQLPGQKLLGSILNGLHTAEKYGDLDLLVNDLIASEYEMKLGMRTTIMHAMIEREKWKETVQFLEETKKLYTLKHARMYPSLIEGLAKSGQLQLAYYYFLEMKELSMTLQTTKKTTPDQHHLVALVDAACQPYTKVNTENPEKEFLMSVAKTIIKDVLDYIKTWNIEIGYELAGGLTFWFQLHPELIKTTILTPDSIRNISCPCCVFTSSESKVSDNFSDLVYNIRENCKKYYLMAKYKLEMSQLNTVLTLFDGEVDVIIDGANIGYSHKYTDGSRRTFDFDLLNDLVDMYRDQTEKKVLVILLQSALRRHGIKQSSAVERLLRQEEWEKRDNIKFIVLRHFSDDTALIYSAALTEYNNPNKKVEIISNDSLTNQRFMFKDVKLQSLFLKWVHSRQRRWVKEGNGGVTLTRNVNSIFQTKGKDFHVNFENGSGICIVHK